MKLKLAAVAVTLAALAPVANAAVQNPQPSFNDNASIEGAASPVATRIVTTVPQNPLPSFNG
jgi:hypothetical protein